MHIPLIHDDAILILNSGSSSLKFGLFGRGTEDEELLLSGVAEGIGSKSGTLQIRSADGTVLVSQDPIFETQSEALEKLASALGQHLHTTPIAVGHRIVHGDRTSGNTNS